MWKYFYSRMKSEHKLINRGSGSKYRKYRKFISEQCFGLVVGFRYSSNECAILSAQFQASSGENVIPTRILRLITRETSSFVTFRAVVFSKEKWILSNTGSFDWNGWNSITMEFRVILSEHCRVYVLSNEKGTLYCLSHIFKMWWCKIIMLDIINFLIWTHFCRFL